MDDDFLNWFAGFVAGEGCFLILPRYDGSGQQFTTRLKLGLRDDDLDILIEIQSQLNIGRIYRHNPRAENVKPMAMWLVTRLAECQKLVLIFRKYPLRARKQQDFEIWAEAVEENAKPPVQRDLAKMRYLADRIKLVRRYDAEEEDEVYQAGFLQLALPDY